LVNEEMNAYDELGPVTEALVYYEAVKGECVCDVLVLPNSLQKVMYTINLYLFCGARE
jgi:hypothetical protein